MLGARRYTVAATARAMGVSRPTYQKWEEHPEKMTIEQAHRLADYLGCSDADLFRLSSNVN
jgi:DNA-binding XRE family transcriptional regulator